MNELREILKRLPEAFVFGNQWDVGELIEKYNELQKYTNDLLEFIYRFRKDFPIDEIIKNVWGKSEVLEWFERYLK